jgi:hypothetical protein
VRVALAHPNVRQGIRGYISFSDGGAPEMKIASDISDVVPEEPLDVVQPIPLAGTRESATQTLTQLTYIARGQVVR